ncbi:CDP-alcohol phosphatidyltransferase family protein [Myxococcota bacterium]|nr:CDP-alcohol phosphatidyltransferase family protein [Myxococcota bacterium]
MKSLSISPQMRRAAAWSVHLFTASGAIAGIAALLAINAEQPRIALLWMLLALFIDSVDGMLARRVQVSEVLPHVDGRRLDDMVDFFNYVLVPSVFMTATGLLAHWTFAIFPILASSYGFSRFDAKTDDGFFLGFPSYWNVVALYGWLLGVSSGLGTAIVIVLSGCVFIPYKFLYPSQMTILWRTNVGLSVTCMAFAVLAVATPEMGRRLYLAELSLLYPLFYLAISFRLGGIRRHRA